MNTFKAGAIASTLILLAGSATALAQTGDFNKDGFADLLVAAPGEDAGSIANAGSVWVFYGGGSGIQMSKAAAWDVSALGATLLGGERLGESCCVGDFNGDGYADAAIGVPGAVKVGTTTHKAAIAVVFGSAAGLSPSSVLWRFFDDASDTWFGKALAAGDFNGDGKDDLAVGAPNADLAVKTWDYTTGRFRTETYNNAGRVYIYTSSSSGPLAVRTSMDYSSLGVPLDQAEWAALGSALAAGDFNADGKSDLAMGAPFHDGWLDTESGIVSSGAVHIVFGGVSSLTASGRQILRPDAELASSGGSVGFVLAAGRFNSDASWDLAMGCPGYMGSVRILYGAPTKFRTDKSDTVFTQDTPGMLDFAEVWDEFGGSLAVGRLNSDLYDDLVVGVPGETIGSAAHAGAVQIIYSRSDGTGLSATNNQLWHQDVDGVSGSCESYDNFGSFVAATRKPIDRSGGTTGNLIIGVPNEDVDAENDGMVHVMRGGTTGVVTTGHTTLHQNMDGVPGTNEAGDHFGSLGAR